MERLIVRAVAEFGLTEDVFEAGFILPDGGMLDFSEKADGGRPGTRGMDHRCITRVFRRYTDRTEAMRAFVAGGAVRFHASRISPRGSADVFIATQCRPTRAQVASIKQVYDGRRVCLIVEIRDGGEVLAGDSVEDCPVDHVEAVLDRLWREAHGAC